MNSKQKYRTTKWIGLAKVISEVDNDVLNGAKNAYVNVLGFAQTKVKFRNEVK